MQILAKKMCILKQNKWQTGDVKEETSSNLGSLTIDLTYICVAAGFWDWLCFYLCQKVAFMKIQHVVGCTLAKLGQTEPFWHHWLRLPAPSTRSVWGHRYSAKWKIRAFPVTGHPVQTNRPLCCGSPLLLPAILSFPPSHSSPFPRANVSSRRRKKTKAV